MLIQDIFFSWQGEGPFIGFSQIFIRTAGCNLSCDYCDEQQIEPDQIRQVSLDDIITQITPYYKKKPHSISLTGGEPLLQVDELKQLIPKLKHPVFLETNGTLPDHLKEIMKDVTYFSIDYKEDYDKEFIQCLTLLKDKKNVYVKFVLLKDFNILILQKLVKIISAINRTFPLILQPVTPIKSIKYRPTEKDLLRAYQASITHLDTVRVIPQTHKILGIK